MASARIGTRALTAELRKLAAQVISVDDDGNPITREAALADLIWKMALGYVEESRNDMGNLVKKEHAPVAWAMQYIFERCEGKAPVAMTDNEGGMKAADKVRQLSKDRLNALTSAVQK